MSTFEVCWKMYGTAVVEADTMDQAIELASHELIGWSGGAVNLETISVDGTSVEP